MALIAEERHDVKPRTLFRFTTQQAVPVEMFQIGGTSGAPARLIARLEKETEEADLPFPLKLDGPGQPYTLASTRNHRVVVKAGRLDILFRKVPGAAATPILSAA